MELFLLRVRSQGNIMDLFLLHVRSQGNMELFFIACKKPGKSFMEFGG